MYQALYRKYRPTTFDDVVGQDVVVKTLINAIKNNKLSHAYIFSGPRGTGKTSIAKILAKAINCEDENSIICDKCVSCTQINNKQSTDIIEIDAASNNGIDEIREIRNKVGLVPTTGKYKVYIIDEVHMLTTGAFNALLKTLEEPPSHAIFILATTEFHKIPATIVSRCQKFEFKKIENKKMFDRVKKITIEEGIKIDDKCIKEIVRLSDGGLRDCISLLDQVNAYTNGNIDYNSICDVNGIIGYQTLINFLIAVFNKDLKYILHNINLFDDNGKNFVKITEELLSHLRNILLISVNKELVDDSEYYSSFINIKTEDIIYLIETLNDGIKNIKNSGDPLLAFELLILKYCNYDNEKYEIKMIDDEIKEMNCINKEVSTIQEISSTSNNNQLSIANECLENTDNSKENSIEYDVESESNFLDEKEENNQLQNVEMENENINNEKTLEFDENNNIENENSCEEYDKLSIEELISRLQKIRIDNTLSKFNKQILLSFKDKMNDFKKYSSSVNYSFAADLILDGQLKAISNEYVVFMYSSQLTADIFNRKLDLVEELISKVFSHKLKAISIDEENWNIIKKEFNEKTREFSYNTEDESISKCLLEKVNNEKKDLDELYGSLVQYEEENK
ncbi:MAG: DNA polymerase III subunit gamma/tau [Tenericutes bacterium]|nr:DNA polymerase III subunit gamma/tau [Mycoplasmatota bacterium]